MNKAIFLIMGLFLVSGCIVQEDITNELCTATKHSNNNENISVYMDNGVCIKETINYSHVYYLECNTFIEHAAIIIKSQDEQPQTFLDDMKEADCDIDKIA